jgi:hypothetical protein
MDETTIDRAAMGRLGTALSFLKGASDPTTLALKAAAASGTAADIRKARLLFLKLKPGDRSAALAMIEDEPAPWSAGASSGESTKG